MKGQCPTCHRNPDYTNIGACPICGRFAWVLVQKLHDMSRVGGELDLERILWACPCGEFRWTSYAEWEKGVKALKLLSDTHDQAEQMVKDGIERLTQRQYGP